MKRNLFILSILFSAIFTFSNSDAQQKESETSLIYKTESDILYRDAESSVLDEYMEKRCRLDIYYPTNKSGFPTVIWFHGGGLKGGNRFIPEQLQNQQLAVIAVNYRLYPKVSCPEYIEDTAAAVSWVFKNIKNYGGDPDLIFVSGHSAGGYLTSMVGLDKKWLAKYDIDADRIAGLIPFSGHTITHFTVRKERGIPMEQPIIDEFAPLFHVRPDAPPLVLITGDRDLEELARYEENAYLMSMMKVVGHEKTTLYEIQDFDHGGMAGPAFSILLRHIEEIVTASQVESK